jgi:hypothetical protein
MATPHQANEQNLKELKLIAKEIGASRIEVLTGAIKLLVYYVDPLKDEPESEIFFDQLEIDLEDRPHKIVVMTFPMEDQA